MNEPDLTQLPYSSNPPFIGEPWYPRCYLVPKERPVGNYTCPECGAKSFWPETSEGASRE